MPSIPPASSEVAVLLSFSNETPQGCLNQRKLFQLTYYLK
jgi:hypothetical protein